MTHRMLILFLAIGISLTSLPFQLLGEEMQPCIEFAEKSGESEKEEVKKEETKILSEEENALLTAAASTARFAVHYGDCISIFVQAPQTPPPEHV